MSFYYGLTVTALLLVAGHWIPWPRKLHRVEAYTYGVGSMLVGWAIWLCFIGQWTLWLALAGWTAVSGAVVISAYVIDGLLKARVRKQIGGDE